MAECAAYWAGYLQAHTIWSQLPDGEMREKWAVVERGWLDGWFDACDRLCARSKLETFRVTK